MGIVDDGDNMLVGRCHDFHAAGHAYMGKTARDGVVANPEQARARDGGECVIYVKEARHAERDGVRLGVRGIEAVDNLEGEF